MRNLSAFQPNGLKQVQLADTALFNDANLVSYWKLDNGAYATDSKGANTLTTTGSVQQSDGKFGYCGSGDNIKAPTNFGLTGTSDLSYSFWMKMTTDISATGVGINFIGSTLTTDRFISLDYEYNGGTRRINLYNSNNAITSSYNITLGTTWHHFAVSRSSGAVTLYIDGVAVISGAAQSTATGAQSAFYLGTGKAFGGSSNLYYDDVAFFSRALSASEIQQLYFSGSTKAYYPLNGNSTDFSGNGNHGTDTAITYPQGRFGQGARFNGSAYITIPHSTSLVLQNSDFTISHWINPSSLATFARIFDKVTAGTGNGYGTDLNSTTVRLLLSTGTDFTYSTPLNRWTHLLFTVSGTNGSLYVNGRHFETKTIANTGNMTASAHIGSASDLTSKFNGLIDEVIIENRAWTAKEVETYYRKSIQNYRQRSFAQIVYTYTSELLKGTYTLTGKNINTLYNRVVQLLKGAYTLTGKQLTANKAYVATLLKGVYNLTGKLLGVPNRWTSQSKNTSTWTEENKNSSTWTNTPKS